MATESRDNAPTPRQRRHSATASHPQQCAYGQVLPAYTTSLVVTNTLIGKIVARTRHLEREQVREELVRLKRLFPEREGYMVRAIVTEVKAE